MENSSDQEQDGKDKSVKSSSLIGSLMPRGLKEAQEMMIFALDHSHNKHKGHIKDCQLGNPHRDISSLSYAHMLYCVVAEEQYNLAYFFVKRIECARATPTVNLPYGMFLTRMSSHQHNDDDDNVKTSRASTPSPNTYLNSPSTHYQQLTKYLPLTQQTDKLSLQRQNHHDTNATNCHEEMRGGFKSFGKALKRVFSKKKK
ncbi:hypothetical protein Tco_0403901 [Tanacetum coccineum]